MNTGSFSSHSSISLSCLFAPEDPSLPRSSKLAHETERFYGRCDLLHLSEPEERYIERKAKNNEAEWTCLSLNQILYCRKFGWLTTPRQKSLLPISHSQSGGKNKKQCCRKRKALRATYNLETPIDLSKLWLLDCKQGSLGSQCFSSQLVLSGLKENDSLKVWTDWKHSLWEVGLTDEWHFRGETWTKPLPREVVTGSALFEPPTHSLSTKSRAYWPSRPLSILTFSKSLHADDTQYATRNNHTLCFETPQNARQSRNSAAYPHATQQVVHNYASFLQSTSTTPSSPVFFLHIATNCRQMLFQWVSYWIWIWHCWENSFLISSLLALMRKQVASISFRWHAMQLRVRGPDIEKSPHHS